MSIGNSRVTMGAIRPRFNRVVAWTLCILGLVPLSGQADHTGRASSNVRPARADQSGAFATVEQPEAATTGGG